MDLDNPAHLRILATPLRDRARAVAAAASAPAGYLQNRIGDETSNLAELLADLTYAVTWQLDEAARHPHQHTPELRRGTAAVSRAAIPVGLALAGLGQAVAQLGALHTLDAYEQTDEQQAAVHRTRQCLEETLHRARRPTGRRRSAHEPRRRPGPRPSPSFADAVGDSRSRNGQHTAASTAYTFRAEPGPLTRPRRTTPTVTIRSSLRTAGVLATSALALALTSCSADDNSAPQDDRASESRATAPEPGQPSAPDPTTGPDDGGGRVLAQVTGRDSIVLTITRVERSAPGKSVTVSATLKNTGTKRFFGISAYGGTDASIKGRMHSLAGATLTDTNMRYYVLRDTAGGCLCSTALRALKPDETVPVFAQFPAPPDNVSSVDFQLPTFPNATIPLGAAR
ncbi:hypothetical protein [Streptomyces niveus]|uniref:hypothetical protein n=1 Tax=Streptomyces niveus TaxID=193462 RepID=UPI00343F5FFD